jgi:CSLREA domain-containing protein
MPRRLNRRRPRLLALECRQVPATFLVTNSLDAGPGSLRDAVALANATPGVDDIVFDPVIFGVPAPTIFLTSGELFATEAVNIKGTTAANCKVSGSGLSRVFHFNTPKSAQPFTVSDLTITGGAVPVGGGGIYSPDEAVSISACVFTGNKAGSGGAVQIDLPIASLSVVGSKFDTNGTFGGPGGAIAAFFGSAVNLKGSAFVSNSAFDGGAAFFGPSTVVKINTCEFTSNASTGTGGAVAYGGSGLAVRDSSFLGNKAVLDGGGVGLFGFPGPLATMVFNGSTFAGNTAGPFGGAIGGKFGGGTVSLTLKNSTLSGNVADIGGGIGLDALSPAGDLTLQNSTLTLNDAKTGMGGGLALLGPSKGFVTVSSTIIAGNFFAGGKGPTADLMFGVATKVAGDTNLIGILEPPTMAFFFGIGNLTGTLGAPLDAKLTPLAANGGPTLTHLPSAFSPAIDKGNNVFAFVTDQRSAGFPRVLGLMADIGAVETKSKIITGMGMGPDILIPGAVPQLITVTYSDDTAVAVGSLSDGDITVVSPSGVALPVLFKGVDIPFDGTPRVATYELAAPAGSWGAADNGEYTIVQSPLEVFDTSGIAAPAGPIGGFSVAIPVTIVVNATNDEAIDTDGKTSLREAILAANASELSQDTITFDPAVFALAVTISLTLGELAITDSVVVDGPANLTIDATGLSRHFKIDNPDRALDVKLTGLKLTGGSVFGDHGGSILVTDEALTLLNVSIIGNAALPLAGGPPAHGGGIALTTSDASLWVMNSLVQSNTAPGGDGGGIYLATTFGRAASLTLEWSTICNNTAGGSGGGIATAAGGPLSTNGSTIRDNVSGASGGGVSVIDLFGTGSVTVTNSTFSGNRSTGQGGGLAVSLGGVGSDLALWNSTFTLNEAAAAGGGISINASFPAPVIHSSTIVAGNKVAPAAPPGTADLGFSAAIPVVGDHNLIGVADPASGALLTGVGNLTGTAALPLDPQLAPLAFNGGPTLCHRLLPTSPALGQGNNAFGLATDQRGPGFPRVQGARADIGSFEAPAPPTVASVVVNGGAVQRSVVTSITVTFSEAVTLGPGAFTLTRNGPGGPTGAVGLTIASAGPVATLTFVGGGAVPVEASGSLIDGTYLLTIAAPAVLGAGGSLDGNGNGASDGSPADDVTAALHRLFGDIDGDRDVDASDYGAFRSAFGTGNPAFDFDGDGDVDAADFGQFRLRFGTSV